MTDHAAAADLLLKNWAATTRITELPEALRPKSRGEGYDAAATVAARSGSTAKVGGKEKDDGKDGPATPDKEAAP